MKLFTLQNGMLIEGSRDIYLLVSNEGNSLIFLTS
jgi:hypothetical protein